MAQSSAAAQLDRRPSLTITRRLRASPPKVYAAWTNAENLIQWFAAQAKPGSIEADLDVRVGGSYRISFVSRDNGEYHEVGGGAERPASVHLGLAFDAGARIAGDDHAEAG